MLSKIKRNLVKMSEKSILKAMLEEEGITGPELVEMLSYFSEQGIVALLIVYNGLKIAEFKEVIRKYRKKKKNKKVSEIDLAKIRAVDMRGYKNPEEEKKARLPSFADPTGNIPDDGSSDVKNADLERLVGRFFSPPYSEIGGLVNSLFKKGSILVLSKELKKALIAAIKKTPAIFRNIFKEVLKLIKLDSVDLSVDFNVRGLIAPLVSMIRSSIDAVSLIINQLLLNKDVFNIEFPAAWNVQSRGGQSIGRVDIGPNAIPLTPIPRPPQSGDISLNMTRIVVNFNNDLTIINLSDILEELKIIGPTSALTQENILIINKAMKDAFMFGSVLTRDTLVDIITKISQKIRNSQFPLSPALIRKIDEILRRDKKTIKEREDIKRSSRDVKFNDPVVIQPASPTNSDPFDGSDLELPLIPPRGPRRRSPISEPDSEMSLVIPPGNYQGVSIPWDRILSPWINRAPDRTGRNERRRRIIRGLVGITTVSGAIGVIVSITGLLRSVIMRDIINPPGTVVPNPPDPVNPTPVTPTPVNPTPVTPTPVTPSEIFPAGSLPILPTPKTIIEDNDIVVIPKVNNLTEVINDELDFESFNFIQPGFGLGTVSDNPLTAIREESEYYPLIFNFDDMYESPRAIKRRLELFENKIEDPLFYSQVQPKQTFVCDYDVPQQFTDCNPVDVDLFSAQSGRIDIVKTLYYPDLSQFDMDFARKKINF